MNLRGKGYGTLFMAKTEEYCRKILCLKTIYLSTKGQEKFYSKLAYRECQPIGIYGNYIPKEANNVIKSKSSPENKFDYFTQNIPIPPPIPNERNNEKQVGNKIYMKKDLL